MSSAAVSPIQPDSPFTTVAERVRAHAQARPLHPALNDGLETLSYGELDTWMDRIACALQRDGVQPGQAIAVCANGSVRYAALYLGALRAGVVVAPLAPSSTAQTLAAMVSDAQAQRLFVDRSTAALMPTHAQARVYLDDHPEGDDSAWVDWLSPTTAKPQPVHLQPEDAFNIIYSSGTTGTPKGIVQSHGMRWAHVRRGAAYGYSEHTKTLLATPLYSNTTLVVFFPTLASGGTVTLMPKFDAANYLRLAQDLRITHAMVVPVQVQRLLAQPDFDAYDLSSFQVKFCTSAPFRADLKAEVLARWPGGLVEFYGMTEGGGTCILNAHEHPDKLHTVGRAAPGSELRLIDEEGRELPTGSTGEVVGRSGGMMTGYHGLPEKTREAEWFDAQGQRFIRTGDIGRFDDEGFLTLMDRRKDMIITGGFNVYPSDLEAQLREHPAVLDVAVVGVASEAWGETPVAFIVCQPKRAESAAAIKDWYNARAGKTQRLHEVIVVDELPRSAIGKVLKRELRDAYASGHANAHSVSG
jgi:long-chain acyl-CoA synthetase